MYGIWKNEFSGNDGCNWYDNHNSAFDAWHEMANESSEDESTFMAEFDEDGDIVEGTQFELRNEGNGINEYDEQGNRLWA